MASRVAAIGPFVVQAVPSRCQPRSKRTANIDSQRLRPDLLELCIDRAKKGTALNAIPRAYGYWSFGQSAGTGSAVNVALIL
jgi:hypothetical protein